jgi:hypothetical protein
MRPPEYEAGALLTWSHVLWPLLILDVVELAFIHLAQRD